MVQGRSTKNISMIKWIRTSRLSITKCLCSPPVPARRDASGPYRSISLIRNRPHVGPPYDPRYSPTVGQTPYMHTTRGETASRNYLREITQSAESSAKDVIRILREAVGSLTHILAIIALSTRLGTGVPRSYETAPPPGPLYDPRLSPTVGF